MRHLLLQLGFLVTVFACAQAWSATIAGYNAGSGAAAFSPAQYGWSAFGIFGASDLQGQGVVDTVGHAAPAWQVTDVSPSGTTPRYYQPLSGPSLAQSRNDGWRMTANARLVSPSQADATMGIGVYFDSAAYLLQLDLQGDALYAYLWDNNNPASILTKELVRGAGANQYHDYEVRWSADSHRATLYFDGQRMIDWDGVPSVHGPNGNLFQFGASTVNGSGVMNFRSVEFASLETSPASQGDYNDDGQVDAADYAVWRKNLGSRVAAADGNGDGFVNQADYTLWRQKFGSNLSPVASDAGHPVPEPTGCVPLMLSLAVFKLYKKTRDLRRGFFCLSVCPQSLTGG